MLRKKDIVYIFVCSDTKKPKVWGIRVRNLISESILTNFGDKKSEDAAAVRVEQDYCTWITNTPQEDRTINKTVIRDSA